MNRTSGGAGMTSRERGVRALSRQEPDRVPLDYVANAGVDQRLKQHFGLEAGDNEGLLCALGVDFRPVGAPYVGPRLHPELPGRHVDPESGIRTRWVEHSSGGYWDFCDFPLLDADDDTIANWPLPSPDDYDYGQVPRQCAAYPEHCLYFGNPGLGDIMNSFGMIRSVEQMMIDMATGYEPALQVIDRRLAVQYEVMRRTLESAEGRIDFVWMGEDLGSQRGPLISRAMFRELLRPRHQRFVDLAKRHRLPVMIHSCGSSSWAFDDFIEMGFDAVDTLQPEAKDMAPPYLKQRYGDHLAFHGCISTAGAVAHGTTDDIIEDVRRTLEVMMPGGGYCLAPTHALQDNSPTENVVAMYETARRYGVYR